MRLQSVCVCSVIHLPVEDRERLSALLSAWQRCSDPEHVERRVLPAEQQASAFSIDLGLFDDHPGRPDDISTQMWALMLHARRMGAHRLRFDSAEPPLARFPVFAPEEKEEERDEDSKTPFAPENDQPSRPVTMRCSVCKSDAVMRDAWAVWDESTQQWVLGAVFDDAFCETCEADALVVAQPLCQPECRMTISPPGPHTVTHVALSSLERSALDIASFDPDAVASILAGARINTIDADDSGTLRHAVALACYPAPLWSALAPAFLGLRPDGSEPGTVASDYAPRAVPDPACPARFIALAPAELEAALEADHPEAMARGDATGARIHCMHRMRWSTDCIAYPAPDDLSPAAWLAAAQQMPQGGGARWSPGLMLRRRSVFRDIPTERAMALVRELEAAIWFVHEAPFACGQDFGAYQASLMRQVMDDSHALAILRSDAEGPRDAQAFSAIADMLDDAGHAWRSGASPRALATAAT